MFADKPIEFKQCYLNFLTEAIEVVECLGLNPVLLNHEGEKDHGICLELLARLENKPIFLSDLSALETKRVIGLSVFCLSSRFHGCISSLSQGVPALATSWSHKYEELYRDYQCPDYLMDVSGSAAVLKDKMEQIVADRTAISLRLLKQAEAQKTTIREMWTEVFKTISS
jgi:colanic acid/amylovoran biosynthesis protein